VIESSAILEAAGGDEDGMLACLASDAIKHVAASLVLPAEVYASLFVSETKVMLKSDAPTKTDLQLLDIRFTDSGFSSR
jgi:hypothetical protein